MLQQWGKQKSEVFTKAALEIQISITMKIVRRRHLKKKEKNVFIRRDHHNLCVRSTEKNYLFVMIRGNIYIRHWKCVAGEIPLM